MLGPSRILNDDTNMTPPRLMVLLITVIILIINNVFILMRQQFKMRLTLSVCLLSAAFVRVITDISLCLLFVSSLIS